MNEKNTQKNNELSLRKIHPRLLWEILTIFALLLIGLGCMVIHLIYGISIYFAATGLLFFCWRIELKELEKRERNLKID